MAADVDVLAVPLNGPLVRLLGSRVVPRAHADAGTDDDLPPRTLGQDSRLANGAGGDVRDEIRGVLHELARHAGLDVTLTPHDELHRVRAKSPHRSLSSNSHSAQYAQVRGRKSCISDSDVDIRPRGKI